MRPTKVSQSPLRAPLNWILGTEAGVRILREIVLAGEALSRTELARRASLSLPGTSGALEKLHRAGVVQFIGTGTRQSVAIRAEHPLSEPLRHLFTSEALRHVALLDEIRDVLTSLPVQVAAAWLEGATDGDPAPEGPIRLGVLVGARDVAPVSTALREALGAVEQRYDVTLLVRTMTRADLEAAEEHSVAGATPVLGPHPLSCLAPERVPLLPGETPGHRLHRDADRRSLATSRWIAERLDRDPTLPRRARSWLVHRMHQASSREVHELHEWLRLLETASITRIQYLLLEPGEQADRLRQSNPFTPVLTEAEREQMREAVGR